MMGMISYIQNAAKILLRLKVSNIEGKGDGHGFDPHNGEDSVTIQLLS
jgi:hypothetical protein